MANLKDIGGRAVNTLHRTLFTTTNGRLGGKVMGMPVVELITTGRKSGQPRSTMLTSPVQDGDTVVLVASWGGDDRNPLWFLNLQANPDVEIVMGGHRRKMRARVATAEEKTILWPRITERYKGYGQYQTRTDRQIPVVICEPA
jgi:deazaflavin-dependent oxidoreductase (nitroreductase family)